MIDDRLHISPVAPQQRYVRRLSDKVLIAFHTACDQVDPEVAEALLSVLDFMAMRTANLPSGADRRAKESLVAAHERMWQLQHPATEC